MSASCFSLKERARRNRVTSGGSPSGFSAAAKAVSNSVSLGSLGKGLLASSKALLELLQLLMAGGLDVAIDKFITHQQTIRDAVNKTLQASNIELSTIGAQVDILSTQNVSDVFENTILNSVKQSVRDSLNDLIVDVPLKTVMSNMQKRMQRAEGRQLTEVKTKLSQYGRSITAIAAAEADIDHFLYTGPDDGVTRDFCEALVNKVVTSKQMRRLDNGQGLSVKTSGGGYNCRHSWSPVTQGVIKAANLQLATSSDINKANQ